MNIQLIIQKFINWLVCNKYIVWYLISLAFLIRIVIAVIQYNNASYLNLADDLCYYEFGENVISQGVFVKDTSQFNRFATTFVGPGMGWIVGIILYIFGPSWLPIFIVSAIVSSLITVFIYKLGKLLFDKKVAFCAAFWSIFYVFFMKYLGTCGKDLWMTFLFLLVIYFCFKSREKLAISKYIIYLSITYFYLIHIDERFLIFGPLIFIFLFFSNKSNLLSGFYKGIVYAVFVIALSTPWLIRNYQVFNRVILIGVRTNKFTEKVFNYEHKEYLNNYEYLDYISPEQIDSIRTGTIQPDKNGEILLYNELGELTVSGGHYNRLVTEPEIIHLKKGYSPHRFTKLETMWATFKIFWRPFDFWNEYYMYGYSFNGKCSLKHNLSGGISYGLLLPFFIIGLILLIIHKPYIGITFLIIVSSYSLLHVLFVPFITERYRLLLAPIIIILGSYGILYFIDRIKSIRFNF